MGLLLDSSPELVEAIKRRGFISNPSVGRRLGVRVLGNNQVSIAVIPRIPIKLTVKTSTIPAAIDNYFRQIWKELSCLLPPLKHIFIQAGGVIPVPSWFLKICQEHAVEIKVFTGDDRPFREILIRV